MTNYIDEINYSENDIAVIGMAVRLPGANSPAEFWDNLCAGRESITFFKDEELINAGVLESDLQNPNYVKANAMLESIESFDAEFFGFSPREAEIIDPQHRLFLTCCWEALESAGYSSNKYPGRIGVFAGAGFNTYLLNLFLNPTAVNSLGYFQTMMMNSGDHLTSVVSYKMNLTGPAVTVQTACSTSLVATHFGCQSLLQGESDMVLAGGASVSIPQKVGYMFQEGGINSPDGHCRAFDAKARGTVSASGIAVVLLKRLSDALNANDTIYAVIKGSAINNDGSSKIGYTAPSVDKQAEVIMEALEISGVAAEEISFVETHGTATPLGDPIEIQALKQAFRQTTDEKNYCAIGSVKTNIGHTNTAAGAAGLIKAALSLYHRKLPESLHFETPNPKIDFAESPFYVNTKLFDLSKNGKIIKAGVSSFGLGGTNAHLVMAEPPRSKTVESRKKWHLIPLSTQNSGALENLTAKYSKFFSEHSEEKLADTAFTLQNGRDSFRCRRFTVAANTEQAAELFDELNPQKVFTALQNAKNQPVAFLFPGLGSQYPRMGIELLETNKFFKQEYDEITNLFRDLKGENFITKFENSTLSDSELTDLMMQPEISLPAIFSIEYALAKTLENYGIFPQMMLGHSFGEYTAACLAGVFSPEKAAKLVLYRAELLEQVKGGAMLSVAVGETELAPYLHNDISVAVINGKNLTTLAGSVEAIDDMQKRLSEDFIESKKIFVATAMHSPLIEPIMRPLEDFVASLSPEVPKNPYISCITGKMIEPHEAINPAYWSGHLRKTVRFNEALTTLYGNQEIIPLEVGPGTTLNNLARQHPDRAGGQIPLSIMKHPLAETDDEYVFLQTLGRLWISGAGVKMENLYEDEKRRRVSLPTYPFDERKFWVNPIMSSSKSLVENTDNQKLSLEKWFYIRNWRETVSRSASEDIIENGIAENIWMIFGDDSNVCGEIIKQLKEFGADVIEVSGGTKFLKISERRFEVNAGNDEDYLTLIENLRQKEIVPTRIMHLWKLHDENNEEISSVQSVKEQLSKSYFSLKHFLQALTADGVAEETKILHVADKIFHLPGESSDNLLKSAVLGLIPFIEPENSNVICRTLDFKTDEIASAETFAQRIINETQFGNDAGQIILRGKKRFVSRFENIELNPSINNRNGFQNDGVYLIIGTTNEVTAKVADYLIEKYNARIAFIEHLSQEQVHDKQFFDETSKNNDNSTEKIETKETSFHLKIDTTNISELKNAVEKVERKLGKIEGIFQVPEIYHVRENSGETHGLLITTILCSGNIAEIFTDKQTGFYITISNAFEKKLSSENADYFAAAEFLNSFAGNNPTFTKAIAISIYNSPSTEPDTTVNPQSQTKNDPEISGLIEMILKNDFSGSIAVSPWNLNYLLANKSGTSGAASENQTEHENLKHSRPEISTEFVPPANEVEQLVADIWRDLLGINQIGSNDNFFELGGHSLIAPQFAIKISEFLEIQIPVEAIFQKPTISEMAEYLETLVMADVEIS